MMDSFLFYLIISSLVMSLAILLLGAMLLRKNGLRLIFTSMMLCSCIMNISWLVGHESGHSPALSGGASILTFPFATLTVLLFVYPWGWKKQASMSLLLVIPGLLLAVWSVSVGMTADRIYESELVYLFVGSCIGVGIAESLFGWLRSRVLRNNCRFLTLGLLIMFVTGPLYAYELPSVGIYQLEGANLSSPLVGTLFFAALYLANPLRTKARVQRAPPTPMMYGDLEPGKCYAISEKRPKYCYTFFKDITNTSNPSLLLTNNRPKEMKRRYCLNETTIIEISAKDKRDSLGVCNLGRICSTLEDFMEGEKVPIVLIDCLHYLLSNNDFEAVAEIVHRLAEAAAKDKGWVILSFSHLTIDEKERLLSTNLEHLKMPSPEIAMENILSAHLGGLSTHMTKLSCKILNKRVRDFTIEDLPEVSRIATNTMMALGNVTHEDAILRNWKAAAKGMQESFHYFYSASVPLLESVDWHTWNPLNDIALRIGDVRRKTEITEQTSQEHGSLECRPEDINISEEVMAILKTHLGDFGANLLTMECANLGLEADTLTQDDVEKLAGKIETTINKMSSFVDAPGAASGIKSKACDLKDELKTISAEE